MKRIFALLLALCLLCGCNVAARWQEQYDLGMRYLNEQNYEEAILAFTEAIRIDEKNVDAYIQLADLYEQLGRIDELRELLTQAVEATGDEALTARLAALPPALPPAYMEHIRYQDELGYYATYNYLTDYQPATPELEAALAPVLAMARGVDEPADPLYLLSEEFEGAVIPWGDSEQRTYFWTLLSDGSLVTVSVDHNETGHQNNLLECRTAGGEGFYWNAFNDDQLIGNGTWKFIRAGMQDYLYEGAFISTKEHWQPYTWYSERTGSQTEGTERRRTVITGTAAAEWLQGETAEERIELEGPVTLMNHSITYTTYKAGVPQAVYTNAAGEAVYNRYQLADGRTAASDDTLPVLVTDDGYEAGSNIGFSDLVFAEGERFTPYSSLQPIE